MFHKPSFSLIAITPIFERVYNIYLRNIREKNVLVPENISEITIIEIHRSNYDEGPQIIDMLSEDENKFVIVLTGLAETHGYFQEKEYIETFKKKNVKKYLLPILGVPKLQELIIKAVSNIN